MINKYNKIFLSIDIEGGEYPWLLSLSQDKLQKFKQICIELHGLNDNSWNSSLSDKIKCIVGTKDSSFYSDDDHLSVSGSMKLNDEIKSYLD